MQFGMFDIMQVPPETPSQQAYAEHLANVVLADELGLDFHFVAERHFMSLYRSPSPSAWLGAVAGQTANIRIGALGYIVPLHNPVRLAEDISMLDHLSQGRMEVGVGLGHRPEELVSLGIDPAVRHPLLMESLVLMQRAWEGKTFSFPGQAFKFTDIYVDPPVQQPHPPLWYTGNDPRAAEWSARNTVSLAIGFQPNERLGASATAFNDEKAKHHSRDDRPYLGLMRHLYVAESDDQARNEMIRDIQRIGEAFAASPQQLAQSQPSEPLGRGQAAEQVERLRANDVIIAGSPETCAQTIAHAAEQLGLNVFLANPYFTGVEQERVQRTISLYAEQVSPRVRDLLQRSD